MVGQSTTVATTTELKNYLEIGDRIEKDYEKPELDTMKGLKSLSSQLKAFPFFWHHFGVQKQDKIYNPNSIQEQKFSTVSQRQRINTR